MNRRVNNKLAGMHETPLSRWVRRASLTFFLSLTFGLILLSKAEILLVERARNAVADAMTPVLSVMSLPVQSGRNAIVDLAQMLTVHERNRQLAEDNLRLAEWQVLARHLQSENARLRAELGHVDEVPRRFVTARVVADASGAFARSLLINAGAAQAIDRDQPVVAGGALVGRVAGVGSRSARVLLLTDLNSHIPVIVGEAGERGILAGNNSATLELGYLPAGTQTAPGDRVVTSGHGGVFPPGLAVGVVTRVEDGLAVVDPLVDFATLTHVRILLTPPVATPGEDDEDSEGAPLSVAAPGGERPQ